MMMMMMMMIIIIIIFKEVQFQLVSSSCRQLLVVPQAAGIPGAAARSPGGAKKRRGVESLRGALPGTAQWGALWTRCGGRAGDGRSLAEFCSHGGLSENSVPLNPMVNDHYPY